MTPVPDRAKAIEAMARGAYDQMCTRLPSGLLRMATWEAAWEETRDAFRDEARAALAALEAEGWGLTSTREVERHRRALEVIAHPGLTPRTEPWSQEVARCALANEPHAALSSVPVEEEGRP